jgi:Resolvase, N terminal domain
VLEHSGSTRLQYALAERAVALGWARSQVAVIDDDLGVSAATADSRKGFARLVTEVTMGRVGVVLGIEMSRLARTGRDWHQLLELCCLSGVLLADPDGVYDPGVGNDRLLLGLSDPGQLLRREWPGHVVDDASLTWCRRGRWAGSVAGSGVPRVPAQREQLAVGGRELGLGFGQFAAQLGQPGRQGSDDAGCAGAAGLTGRRVPGGCALVAAEPFDAGP